MFRLSGLLDLKDKQVLDYGWCLGILGIAALKLGAKNAIGVGE